MVWHDSGRQAQKHINDFKLGLTRLNHLIRNSPYVRPKNQVAQDCDMPSTVLLPLCISVHARSLTCVALTYVAVICMALLYVALMCVALVYVALVYVALTCRALMFVYVALACRALIFVALMYVARVYVP